MEPSRNGHKRHQQGCTLQFPIHVQRHTLRNAKELHGRAGFSLLEGRSARREEHVQPRPACELWNIQTGLSGFGGKHSPERPALSYDRGNRFPRRGSAAEYDGAGVECTLNLDYCALGLVG